MNNRNQFGCCKDNKIALITHVIFDLDGTIIDSESAYTDSYEMFFEKHGKVYTPEIQQMFVGMPWKNQLKILKEELNFDVTEEEFIRDHVTNSLSSADKFTYMKGAEDMIMHLLDKNIPMAIATSSTQHEFEAKTSHLEACHLMNHVVCGDDPELKHGKPFPDIYLICAKRFPRPPDPWNCLVFEDSPNGVKSALSAGMHVVMIPASTVPYEFWKTATLRVDSFEDVPLGLFGLPILPKHLAQALTPITVPSEETGNEAKNNEEDVKDVSEDEEKVSEESSAELIHIEIVPNEVNEEETEEPEGEIVEDETEGPIEESEEPENAEWRNIILE